MLSCLGGFILQLQKTVLELEKTQEELKSTQKDLKNADKEILVRMLFLGLQSLAAGHGLQLQSQELCWLLLGNCYPAHLTSLICPPPGST